MTTTPSTSTAEPEEPSVTTTEATPTPAPASDPAPTSAVAPTSTSAPAGITRARLGRRGRTLLAVLQSERIKATTVRANRALLGLAATVGLLIGWATAAFDTDGRLTAAEVFVSPTLLTAVLAAVAGIVLFTAELQHGTLAGALAAHPSRWPIAAAKTLVAAAFGLLLGAVGLITGFLGALAGGIPVGSSSGVASTVLWALLSTVGSAMLGLGVGMVVRHSAGAVSGLLVWWLVVEGLVVSFAPVAVVRLVPFDASARTLGIETDMDRPEVVAAALPNPVHAGIFWAYVLTALALGTVTLLRRDVD